MLTDGCPQEYLPFIQNTGVGTTFPNATHSLCYFHTAILGFNHNVTLPKPVPTPEQAQAIETVRCFVKSWFFDLESEEEYNYSRAALRKYLMLGNGKVLPQHTVDSISSWLTTSLEKSGSMWLNHLRLHVCTVNLRTTSVSEAMHSSMKSGFDGVRAGMGTDVTANTMMDKTQRLLRLRDVYNANQLLKKKKWSDMPTADFLTRYCQEMAEEQWDLRFEYAVVHAKTDEWWVYFPHTSSNGLSDPPRFTRLRSVKLVEQKYLWCSCGLPSRMKYPCRHIYAVTQEVSLNMFGVRWHSNFQYHYSRDTQWTACYSGLMEDEYERTKRGGRPINVEKLEFLSKTLDSWIPVEQHGNPLVLQAKNLHQLMQEKTLAIRGMPLPCAGDAPEALETAHEIEIHLPDQIRELQMSQQNAATLMVAHKDTFNEQTLDLLRACQKLAGNMKERQKILVNSLEQAHGLLSAVVASLPENRKRDSIIAFPVTGKSKQQREKRKKNRGGH
ncbi:SWIM zinc finger domain protein [Nitzschia inconspicua]|uniref:SWIM zinc finger domain protein n=1 Tax=Nitzschia inconspicua TaxID=303405 RepID=A0A9K3PQ14_9STRA|nr:SWIM zinc finger domain protein [Nitzschia inconspicua]